MPAETSAVDPLTYDSNFGVIDKAAAVVGSKTPFPYAPACFEERHKESCVIAFLRIKSSCTCEVHA
jgi:hypothetical protein